MNTVDMTAGVKYNLNLAGIDFTLGVRVLELYLGSNVNQISSIPVLYSKADLVAFFNMMEISSSLIQDTPGQFLFSSSIDLTNRVQTIFMKLENNGNSFSVKADGNLPTFVATITASNFINPVNLVAHPGFGLNIKIFMDGVPIFNGPIDSGVTDNNTFLTYLNTNYSQYGKWTKSYNKTNNVTSYTLSSKVSHNVSILAGNEANNLLMVNVGTAQTITFPAIPNMAYTAGNYTLLATSSAGLSISYVSSDPSKATIVNGNQLHPIAAGTFNVTASQAGNTDYAAATPVVNSVTLT